MAGRTEASGNSAGAGLTVDDLRPLEVEFVANRIRCDEALWVSNEWVERTPEKEHALRAFARQFSAAVRGGECFASMPYENDETVVLKAERYGGPGVGQNGGGSRCGNIDGYQLKGIGPNPLVGDHDRIWHSYGGLNARDGVYEALMAKVLARVLPVGVARIYGVILTARDGAYYEGEESDPSWTRGWGAILVREICLRPGHFLRVPNYKPRRDRGRGVRIPPDSVRVRNINRALRAAFPTIEELIQRLGEFLRNCAEQFAFAKLARLAHCGVGPSNLCFDGRWIDLTNTTFIEGGKNLGGMPPIYEEPLAVRQIVAEFLDTFSKYNALELDARPLIKYYEQQLGAYQAYHLPFLFGIDPATVAHLTQSANSRALLSQVARVLNSGRTVITGWPTCLSENDPVLGLQRGLFASLFDRRVGFAELAPLERVAPGFSADLAAARFATLVRAAHGAAPDRIPGLANFAHLCAIDALKRTVFAEYFFRGLLVRRIKGLLDTEPFACRGLIEESIALAEWIFKPAEDGCSILYRSDGFSLAFDARAGSYIVTAKGSNGSLATCDPAAALTAAERSPLEDFVVQSYDFRVPLRRLLSALIRMRMPRESAGRLCEAAT